MRRTGRRREDKKSTGFDEREEQDERWGQYREEKRREESKRKEKRSEESCQVKSGLSHYRKVRTGKRRWGRKDSRVEQKRAEDRSGEGREKKRYGHLPAPGRVGGLFERRHHCTVALSEPSDLINESLASVCVGCVWKRRLGLVDNEDKNPVIEALAFC